MRDGAGTAEQRRGCFWIAARVAGSRRRRGDDEHVVCARSRDAGADGTFLQELARRHGEARSAAAGTTAGAGTCAETVWDGPAVLLGRVCDGKQIGTRD